MSMGKYCELLHVFEAGDNQLLLRLVDDVLRSKFAHPRIHQNFADRNPLFEIFLQELRNQDFGLVGTSFPNGIAEDESFIQNFADDQLVLLVNEGRIPG
jgi:hypothetical protein